jgi:hypothetical protein
MRGLKHRGAEMGLAFKEKESSCPACGEETILCCLECDTKWNFSQTAIEKDRIIWLIEKYKSIIEKTKSKGGTSALYCAWLGSIIDDLEKINDSSIDLPKELGVEDDT